VTRCKVKNPGSSRRFRRGTIVLALGASLASLSVTDAEAAQGGKQTVLVHTGLCNNDGGIRTMLFFGDATANYQSMKTEVIGDYGVGTFTGIPMRWQTGYQSSKPFTVSVLVKCNSSLPSQWRTVNVPENN
jgi:hypothetical protein